MEIRTAPPVAGGEDHRCKGWARLRCINERGLPLESTAASLCHCSARPCLGRRGRRSTGIWTPALYCCLKRLAGSKISVETGTITKQRILGFPCICQGRSLVAYIDRPHQRRSFSLSCIEVVAPSPKKEGSRTVISFLANLFQFL